MALSDSVTSATVEVGPFAFRVFLGRHRKGSQNNLKILKDFFALRRVLGSNWRLSGSRNHTPLDVSFSFSVVLACSTSLGGLVEERGTLVGLPLLSSTFLETVSAWGAEEFGRPDARIAGG